MRNAIEAVYDDHPGLLRGRLANAGRRVLRLTNRYRPFYAYFGGVCVNSIVARVAGAVKVRPA